MMNKYIKHTLRRYIPLFAVTFAICFAMFLMYFSSISVTKIVYSPYDYPYYGLFGNYTDSGLIIAAIPIVILTTILPLFANSYRNSIKGADVFYQVGKGKKSIRYVNNLVLLAAVIASFTAAFIFGLGVLFLRQIPNINTPPEVISQTAEQTVTKYYLFFNFWYYIPAYLFIIAMGIVNYFISYFFVTRANNTLNSIIVLVLGHLILGIGLMTPIWYIEILCGYANPNYTPFVSNTLAGTQTASFVGPIAWIQMAFNGLITGENSGLTNYLPNEYYANDIFAIVLSAIGLLVFIGMGALGFRYFLKENESSGELCGKPQGRGIMQYIIFNIGFGLIGLWNSSTNAISGSIITITGVVMVIAQGTIFGAIYFVFTGLIRRNFRLNKKNLIILFSSVALNLTLGIILTSIIPSRGL